MPSSTLTWSAPHGESSLQSTFAATNQGAIQLLNQYLVALSAFSDFPWQVCAFEGTTAPWYIVLKRKSGAAGRLLVVGVSSAPGVTYNPQLGSVSWSAAGVRNAWFPNATSDTPANILATSGDVFTNPSGTTGMAANMALTNGSNVFSAWACEDGVFIRYAPVGGAAQYQFGGGILAVDASDNAVDVAIGLGGVVDSVSAQVTPGIATSGIYRMVSGSSIQYGTGWVPTAALSTRLRDNALKKAWFLPRSLSCISTLIALDQTLALKLRQMAFGPTPLAGYEQLIDTGAVLKATSTSAYAADGFPWLTNFKV